MDRDQRLTGHARKQTVRVGAFPVICYIVDSTFLFRHSPIL